VRGLAPFCDPLSTFLIDDKEKYLQAELVWFTLRKSLQTNLLITPLKTTTTMGRATNAIEYTHWGAIILLELADGLGKLLCGVGINGIALLLAI